MRQTPAFNRSSRPSTRASNLERRTEIDIEYYDRLKEDALEMSRRAEIVRQRWRSMTEQERRPFLQAAVLAHPQQTEYNQMLYAQAELLQRMKPELDKAA